jgi:hypothetical protein
MHNDAKVTLVADRDRRYTLAAGHGRHIANRPESRARLAHGFLNWPWAVEHLPGTFRNRLLTTN